VSGQPRGPPPASGSGIWPGMQRPAPAGTRRPASEDHERFRLETRSLARPTATEPRSGLAEVAPGDTTGAIDKTSLEQSRIGFDSHTSS
jgi:hypothetical protein